MLEVLCESHKCLTFHVISFGTTLFALLLPWACSDVNPFTPPSYPHPPYCSDFVTWTAGPESCARTICGGHVTNDSHTCTANLITLVSMQNGVNRVVLLGPRQCSGISMIIHFSEASKKHESPQWVLVFVLIDATEQPKWRCFGAKHVAG